MTSRRLIYGAILLIFVFGIVVIAVAVFAFGVQGTDIGLEIFKAGTQLVLIGVLGGGVAFFLRQLDSIHHERNQIDEYRLRILREVVASYNNIKSARRILRAYGFNSIQATTLTHGQITEFVAQMRILNEAQLSLERIKLEVKAQPNIFQDSTKILNCLDTVERYINDVIGDWENHGKFVWSGARNERFSSPQLQNLYHYLARARVSFRERAAKPLDTLVETISRELLRGQRMDKRSSGT